MGSTAGRLARERNHLDWYIVNLCSPHQGFLGGIHFTCLLAGGIPKLGDLGVEGHPASAQVNARVLQQGFLTLGLYDRKV